MTCLSFRDYREILENFPNKSTLKMQILVLSRRIDEENLQKESTKIKMMHRRA